MNESVINFSERLIFHCRKHGDYKAVDFSSRCPSCVAMLVSVDELVGEVMKDERAVSGTIHWIPGVRLPIGTKLFAVYPREKKNDA